MDRIKSSAIFQNKRIGFHYFPDTLHYRVKDLSAWLPHLLSLDASWLILQAPADRAIPEHFISGLLENNIEPIIHFSFPPETLNSPDNLEPLLYAYSRWGVKKAILFDRPNLRSTWSAETWTKKSLIDQFLAYFEPLALRAVKHGISPVFPPLYPGGDYWDTVFLKTALEKLSRKDSPVMPRLQLSSYIWSWEKPLNWGQGGASSSVKARPYSSPDRPDQRGFRNFEWYDEISRSILGRSLPIHLLGAGLNQAPELSKDTGVSNEQAQTGLKILKVLSGEKLIEEEQPIAEIPTYVHSVNFWVLSADPASKYYHQAWFKNEESKLSITESFQKYLQNLQAKKKSLAGKKPIMFGKKTANAFVQPDADKPEEHTGSSEQGSNGLLTKELEKLRDKIKQANPAVQPSKIDKKEPRKISPEKNTTPTQKQVNSQQTAKKGIKRPIKHYLLLPTYEWGISEWHLDVIRPFVKKHRVTVGFSIREAVLANKVTVVGNRQNFPDELLDKLRKTGCEVERISGDGTSIATQLRMR